MGNKKITIYKLIKLIKQNKAPKKVIYNGSEYKFCKDIGDYRRLGWEHCLIIKDVFTFDNHFHNSLYNMLNCKVEILSEENNEQHTKMQFPDTFEEFIKSYSFIDDKEIHTNGSELIPTFRLKQWEEHKKEENDEWEDIEEIDIKNEGNGDFIINEYGTKCGLTKHSKIIAEKVNKLIKNQKYLKERLDKNEI